MTFKASGPKDVPSIRARAFMAVCPQRARTAADAGVEAAPRRRISLLDRNLVAVDYRGDSLALGECCHELWLQESEKDRFETRRSPNASD
jgi:hypothetical protein